MITRPSFESIYMKFALEIATRSTCLRTNSAGERMAVGCIITSPDHRKVFSLGYNGGASGLKNGCDVEGDAAIGGCGCLHAEENAIINCDVPRQFEKNVYCTHLPCVMCCKRLINLGGVRVVYYSKDYRIRTGLDLLRDASIKYEQFT